MNIKLPMNELRISITSKCNMQCTYCHNEGNKTIDELNISTISNLIDAALKYNLKNVRITGGEPLLHNNIYEICKKIKSKDNSIKIGINTNGILIDKLCMLIDNKLVDRVVVGIDYFNKPISKNSTIGKNSIQILNNILKLKKYGINLSISTVYDGNYNNIKNMTQWAIENGIRIKILEIVDNEISTKSTDEYIDMQKRLIKDFKLTIAVNNIFNEKEGYINGKRVISFFHSHCRLRECEYCKNMHLRVMSNSKFKPCLLNSETEIAFSNKNIEKQLVKSLGKLGIPPKNNL